MQRYDNYLDYATFFCFYLSISVFWSTFAVEMKRTAEQIALDKERARLMRRFHSACADYGLLEDGDHVLIGLSGGKDSLLLTELLGRQARIYKPSIRVTAVYVSVENIGYQTDVAYLQSYCDEWGVPFVHKTTRYDELPAEHRNKNHCFLCSWYRRNALFDVAREMGCNKIALGHHRDDILETLLLNMVYGGNISTMPPMLQLDKMPLRIIRPLCLCDEADIRRYAEMAGYKKQVKSCPFEQESSRARTKNILGVLAELNPQVRDSMWAAMENIKGQYLPKRKINE